MFITTKYQQLKAICHRIDLTLLLKLVLPVLVFLPAPVTAQNIPQTRTYTVKPGDDLVKIAERYGNTAFWRQIYKANQSALPDPDLIHPGQRLLIPLSIKQQENTPEQKTLLQNRPAKQAKSGDENKQEILERFRKAFGKVTGQKAREPSSPDNSLEFGGLLINETRSKMGNDFFSVFYKNWEDPQNAGNFILTVTEQPVPSLGALITVKLDHQTILKLRLQPRFAVIEQLAKQAVTTSYRHLQRRMMMPPEIIAY